MSLRENYKSEYNTWCSIRKRCYSETCQDFKYYGGRGISVCDRWRTSFTNFLLDMGPKPEDALTIDRINNDGNYEPSNCRWASRLTQTRNTRRTIDLTGAVFGRLLVTCRSELRPGRSCWECICECGKTIVADSGHLKTGAVKSCGCLRDEKSSERNKRRTSDLAGQVFGRLTAIMQVDSTKNYTEWVCTCGCGNTKVVARSALVKGDTKSCGCLRKEIAIERNTKRKEA